jgi:hypothetical protein
MTDRRVRCMFCYAETADAIKPSKEHLLSRPVASAFGVDRNSSLARMNADVTSVKWVHLNGIQYKCVCTKCNNGWMNELETRMGEVASWLGGDSDEPLGPDRNLALRSWAIKSHLLLCFLDGNAGHFGEDTFPDEVVVPPFTPARQLYERDFDSIHAAIGVSRSGASTDFAWSFGFPAVKATGPGEGHARFAPATVLTLGALQLWIVLPLLDAAVSAPEGVLSAGPDLRPRDLLTTSHPLTVDGLVVDFG